MNHHFHLFAIQSSTSHCSSKIKLCLLMRLYFGKILFYTHMVLVTKTKTIKYLTVWTVGITLPEGGQLQKIKTQSCGGDGGVVTGRTNNNNNHLLC